MQGAAVFKFLSFQIPYLNAWKFQHNFFSVKLRFIFAHMPQNFFKNSVLTFAQFRAQRFSSCMCENLSAQKFVRIRHLSHLNYRQQQTSKHSTQQNRILTIEKHLDHCEVLCNGDFLWWQCTSCTYVLSVALL